MSNWKTVRLGDVCITNANTFSVRDNWRYINYLDTGNITNNQIDSIQNLVVGKDEIPSRAKRRVVANDIVFSTVRPNQRHYGYIKEPLKNMVVSTGFTTITSNTNKAFPKFIYYFLSQNEIIDGLQAIAEQSVSTYPSLKPSDIESLYIDLPSLEEQKRIAGILGALDDKIECNNRINRNLEEQAAALFRRWFVDFEFPDKNGNPYRSAGGTMQDSPPGPIPTAWHVGTLLEIANYLNGLAMQKFRPLDGEQGIPVLKIKELGQGKCDSSSDLCSESIKEEYIINDGDVVFSWSGTLMTDIWCGGKCGLNQHLFKVTSSVYPKWFYFQWTKYHLDKFIRIAKDKAVTMGHIKRGDLQKSPVLVPDGVTLVRMNELMSPLLAEQIALNIENRTLATLRDTLLPKLMNNQINL